MRRNTYLLLFLSLFFFGCNSEKDKTRHQNSFCFWNTVYDVDTTLIQSLDVQHMYIRYFDVDWDASASMAKPIASIRNVSQTFTTNFTPSIYLTNRVFEKSTKVDLDSLSSRISRRIMNINKDFAYTEAYRADMYNSGNLDVDSLRQSILKKYDRMYDDILIDCDWTNGTKDNFFYFVERLKKDIPDKEISVTLRLWQYKDRKNAGVPPVERCLLMCYNMQMANDYKVENSIATMDELRKYISGDKYPLSLDIALPIFNWGVLFRNEEFVGLLGNVDTKNYEVNPLDYEKIDDNRFKILNDIVVGNFLARRGDIIRVESLSKAELEEMATYLQSEIKSDKQTRITFFTWNKTFINNYGTDELKKIYTKFAD